MASIPGLTDAQNAELEYVDIGDLIFIEAQPIYHSSDDESDENGNESDENGDDSDENGNESDDSENRSIAENSDEQGEEDEVDEVDEDEEEDMEQSDPRSSEYSMDSSHTSGSEDNLPHLPAMFLVISMRKAGDGRITDLRLSRLRFSSKTDSNPSAHVYHIEGEGCATYHDRNCAECKQTISINQIVRGEGYHFIVDPSGDHVRHSVATNASQTCIHECTWGWLDSVTTLRGMMEDYDLPLLTYGVEDIPDVLLEPVCPVCVGPEYTQDQQTLQLQLLQTQNIGMMEVVDFLARLNSRRADLGYPFRQLDERNWGFAFDDMLSDEDEDEDEDGRFEAWDDAMDPNNDVELRPASDSTIAALPRQKFEEATLTEESCPVCQENFEHGAILIKLPCNHANFHEECIVLWLKRFDNCPNCRAVVPDVDGKPREEEKQARTSHPGPAQPGPVLANRSTQSNAYRMNTGEALRYFGIDETLDNIDKGMLPIVFEYARYVRPSDRTENAIRAIERAVAITEDQDEVEGWKNDSNSDIDDGEGVSLEDAQGSNDVDTVMQDCIMSDE
jgi:hypothetical protein